MLKLIKRLKLCLAEKLMQKLEYVLFIPVFIKEEFLIQVS